MQECLSLLFKVLHEECLDRQEREQRVLRAEAKEEEEKEERNQPLPCSLVWHSLSEVGHSEEGGGCLSQQMLITQNGVVWKDAWIKHERPHTHTQPPTPTHRVLLLVLCHHVLIDCNHRSFLANLPCSWGVGYCSLSKMPWTWDNLSTITTRRNVFFLPLSCTWTIFIPVFFFFLGPAHFWNDTQ